MLYEVIPPIPANVTADPDWMVSFAEVVERLGFDGIVVPEHVAWVESAETEQVHDGQTVVTGPRTMFPDPVGLLAFLAAKTTRLTLSTGIMVLPQHHPVVMAKRLATLDVLSKGRVRLGIGVGWNRDEMELCGQNFASRGKRTDDAIKVLRTLWSGSSTEGRSYSGSFYAFEHVFCNPKPRAGSIPIHIGGSSNAAAIRAGRLGNGFQPLNLEGELLAERVETMRTAAREAGRDPDSLELSLRRSLYEVDGESVEADRIAGATRIILNGSRTADLDRAIKELEAFSARMNLRPVPVHTR